MSPPKREGPRINEEIEATEVRLVDENGEQAGVVSFEDAMQRATVAQMDLVEVSPNAAPPVCKIIDYGKLKYQEQKKKNEARKKQKTIDVKEIKLRPNIDTHDYDVKMRNARRFIDDGDKVKVTLRFRGREMTKGQYSPTSKIGTKSPSTPMGSVDNPVSAAQFALGVGGTFIARSSDILMKHLTGMLKRAHGHRGTSFLEIFQNCIVYNDGAFKHFTEKAVQDEMQIHVEHGEPLLFGKDKSKGLILNTEEMRLEAVTLGENGITEADIAIHDETNRSLATMLAQMDPPEMPVALGVLYCEPAPTYEGSVHAQIAQARKDKGEGDLTKLLHQGQTWTVE